MKLMRSRNRLGQLNEFSIEFCTWNRATGKGGERIIVDRAILYMRGEGSSKKKSDPKPIIRNPQHELNGTRNILILPSREIRTIHIRLIERFNNKIVFD